MAKMTIVRTYEELQEGYHLVPEDVYGKVALLIMVEMHDPQRGLTPHEADTGHTCPSCGGRGYWTSGSGQETLKCLVCNGTGQV